MYCRAIIIRQIGADLQKQSKIFLMEIRIHDQVDN